MTFVSFIGMFDMLVKYKESIVVKEELKLPVEAIKSAICSCYFGLIWDRNYLENSKERDSTASDAQSLRLRFDKYLQVMQEMMLLEISGPGSTLKEEAFISVCDLLIFFSGYEGSSNSSSSHHILAPLLFRPGKQMASMLNDFIQSNVFVAFDGEDDSAAGQDGSGAGGGNGGEQDDHTKIEVLHKRRNFLASSCKLIVYNILPTKAAADIFKHYLMFYNDYGDIIKATLSKTRDNNKVNSAKAMVQALITKFKELKQMSGSPNVIDRNTVEFHQIKELAKR